MAKFATTNGSSGQAMTTTYKSCIGVYASSGTQALRRGKVYEFSIGTLGTPADNAIQWDISRQTASGTATAGTLNPLDTADASAAALSAINHTAEPTITASSSMFNLGVNQRASYRWVAAPGGELIYPATASNGFAMRGLSTAYTGNFGGYMHVDEQ